MNQEEYSSADTSISSAALDSGLGVGLRSLRLVDDDDNNNNNEYDTGSTSIGIGSGSGDFSSSGNGISSGVANHRPCSIIGTGGMVAARRLPSRYRSYGDDNAGRAHGNTPPHRYRHTAVLFADSAFVFGGVNKQHARFNGKQTACPLQR